MTNIERLLKQPYGDNLVARCDNCGKPVFKCKCDEEDNEDPWELTEDDIEYANQQEQDTDGFGRNYSDADPGL